MKYIIAIDLGGTKLKVAIVSDIGKILEFIETQTEAEKGKDFVIEKIKNLISQLLKKAKNQNLQISGIGVGAPGPLDIKTGEIINPPNLPGWKDVPLGKILNQEFNLPVKIDNDTNCALLGEVWKGAAKNCQNAIMLTLGTGVGGAILIDGKLYRGSHGIAGELGHITINKNGPRCGCDDKGCLEVYTSAKRLEQHAQKLGLKFKNARDIFLIAAKENPQAKKLVSELVENLAVGLANLIDIFDPEIIILGGDLIKSSDLFLEDLENQIIKKACNPSAKKIKIIPSKLGDKSAGILGAASLYFG